ncbi:lipopolysaccharide core heptose(I) kinase RfaP [Endozoicomonas numazuensis]|uniref:Lipopolysaccharide core heptose(I) kinase n=1 Tax=Endozoicomonas numazuensis TaxID=1137799 RepID=A0A081NIL7_9GAMM|nr:lipopolysaccharide core heptose(I) kinase RfaP [Endozoicomonas numazuensis]KEQ18290.1 heptose kinase [Endozoicomonas numazuensis]
MLYLRDDFKKAWQGKDPQTLLETMDGEVYRALEARRTFRFELNGKGYFAKVHGGVGWYEILENFLHLRKPVLGARHEWEALNKLHEVGIDTMTPVAYGETGNNPATLRSFLVTEELADMVTLEDFCEQWKNHPPSFRLKQAITLKLAEISKKLHDHGINHRDYYLCHFMMPNTDTPDPECLKFYLIDLHRAQIRDEIPDRWRLKDLSGLYFSAMDYGITRNDIFRFLKAYTGLPLRDTLKKHNTILEQIERKAVKLYQRMERKAGQGGY